MRVWILFSHLTSRSSSSWVFTTASRKYVINPISAVFHLLTIFVNVVDPEAIRIWRTRLWNRLSDSSSTRRKHWAVRSFVTSFCRFHTPSRCVNSSFCVRHLGRMRHSKPLMLNSRFGLSFEYTDTNVLSHWTVVTERGNRFLMSQNTARPRLTSCFIRRIRASRGQHFLLLYPTMFSLFGSGCSVR
uniref:Putative secreted protein n=1 Tax=Anopheles triannulatus TaxID=58253 RepID=A0A2M4B1T5_9DIPT